MTMATRKPRLLFLSLGGTITMVPSAEGGIAPKLGAAELVASVPELGEVGDIDARSPFRLPSPSLTTANLVDVAATVEQAFAEGIDGAVVIQGTDTIEESAFLLDALVDSDKPVIVTGAMRGADAPGADGPANLLSAAIAAASPETRGLGTLAVLNYDIHAARFVQKSHTALPSAFLSPLVGPLGAMIERRACIYARVARTPCLSAKDGPPAPVALIKMSMGDDGRLLKALPDLGYAGAVIEGMGAGHVLAEVAPILGELATRMPVVLASRSMTGPVFTKTYGYPGAEIDLIKRGLIPSGYLSGLKARLLLSLVMRDPKGAAKVAGAFAPYQ
jgi:L-asparaginase